MVLLPSFPQVQMIEPSLLQRVPKEFEDENGHVSVMAFYELHQRASDIFFAKYGFDDSYRNRTGQSVFSIEQHIRFYDEALVGHKLSHHVRLLGRSEKAVHGVSILANVTTEQIANTLEFVEIHVDLASRRASPFTAELASELDRLIEHHNTLPWSLPLAERMGVRT